MKETLKKIKRVLIDGLKGLKEEIPTLIFLIPIFIIYIGIVLYIFKVI